MHVFLSPLLNSKTSDPPTVQTFYEACIVASLSYPLVKDTVWFWGTISSKIKMPYARNIALDQICVFFSLHVLLQDPIRSYKCFCCPPHKDERGVGETQSPCNQNNKSDNCCWCFLTVSWNMRCWKQADRFSLSSFQNPNHPQQKRKGRDKELS